jgi:crossover junction endodeoxyribonuclease RusA
MTDIELPFPAKILWPNGRGHHMAKHRAFKKHRQWAHDATLAALRGQRPELGERIAISATFYPLTRHPIDKDNAVSSLKAFLDGIAAALKVNDSRFEVPSIQFAEPVKHGKIVVRIEG